MKNFTYRSFLPALIALSGIIFSSIFITSCGDNRFGDFDKTESGLRYKFYTDSKDTTIAGDGDLMSILIDYRRLDDSVFYSNSDMGPIDVHLRESEYKGDIFEGLAMMHIGDSATFVASVDSFFTKIQTSGIPDYLDSGSFFFLDVKLVDIKTKAQQQEEQRKKLEELQQKEKPLIDGYIKDNNVKTAPDSNGVYYISVKKGRGKDLKAGYYAKLNLKINLLDNPAAIYDSWLNNNGEGIEYMIGTGYFGLGFDLSLANSRIGDSYKLLVPSSMAFGARGAEGIVPPYSPLLYTVEVLDMYSEDEYNTMRKKKAEKMQADEKKEIAKYVKSHGIDAVADEDGIYKQIIKPGDGEAVRIGDNVSVHYTGYLLDGTKFDSSYDRKEPFNFSVGTGSVIPGWDKGVSTMKVGEKAVFIIPSALAYGSQGSGGVIPPNSPLVFEIEVVKINK